MRQLVVLKTDTRTPIEFYPAAFAWLGLVAVYMGFLSVGFVFHFLPPILPVIIADLQLSHTEAGLLMSLFALPGILLSLPGGWLVDRYGERLIGGLGVVLMGVGTLLLGLAPNFPLILLARILSGAGAMVGVVALQRLVVRLFAGRSLGLPLGISGSAVPVGIIIVLNLAGPLAEAEGWRIVAQRVGVVTALIGVVFVAAIWFVTRGQELGRNQKQDAAPLSNQARIFRPLWIGGAVWFCANGAMTAFMTFAPDHFQGLGFDVSARGLFTSIPMWTSAALGVVTGWLTDRHGGRAIFMAVGLFMMGTALVVLPTLLVPPALIGLVLGLSLAAVVTPTIALPGVLLPPTHTGRGYGILSTCANLGIFIVPPLAGLLRDFSGGYVWPFVLMGIVAFAGVVAAEMLRRGRYMPGWSRRALVLVALILVAGCGKQDRYDVVAPVNSVAGVVRAGQVKQLSTMMYGNGLRDADAWSVDDMVEVGRFGRATRIQGDIYTPLLFPTHDNLEGVLCQPGGEVLVVTTAGQFWQWSGGDWLQLPSVPVSDVEFLIRDHLGYPLCGGEYDDDALYRYQSGAWVQVANVPDGLVQAWSHPDQGTWLVTENRKVLQLTPTGVAEVDSVVFEDNYGFVVLAGDGTDKLAMSLGNRELWLSEGGVATIYAWYEYVRPQAMFWREGVLHCVEDSGQLYTWDRGHWLEVPDVDLGRNVRLVLDLEGQQLKFSAYGGAHVYDGVSATQIAWDQGDCDGLVEHQGRLMLYMQNGSLFQTDSFDSGVWQFVAQTENRARDNPLNNALLVDDQGRLLVKGVEHLWHWDGTTLHELPIPGYVLRAYTMPDGEVLINSDEGIASLRGGEITFASTEGFYDYSIRGLRRRSATEVEILNTDGLYVMRNQSAPELRWVVLGWDPSTMSVLGEGWAMVMGYGNSRELVDGRWQDAGLFTRLNNAAVAATVTDFCVLDDGRLLGWSTSLDALVVRENAIWQTIEPVTAPILTIMRSIGQAQFVKTDNHGLFLLGETFVGAVDMSGGTP